LYKEKKMYKLRILAILILSALILASCGQTPTAEVVTEPTAVPVETQKTLLRVAHSWPARIDPAVGGDFVALTFHPNIYDTLVFPNTDGTIGPWLAESWDISDDGLSYAVHWSQGVLFHEGTDLKASDVVYTMNRLLTLTGHGILFTNHVASTGRMTTL
jgi:peptide/nickel transport system substrate-binding protein